MKIIYSDSKNKHTLVDNFAKYLIILKILSLTSTQTQREIHKKMLNLKAWIAHNGTSRTELREVTNHGITVLPATHQK